MKPSDTILAAAQDPAWEITDVKPHPVGVQFSIRGSNWRGKCTIIENGPGLYNVRFFLPGQKRPVLEDTTIPNVTLNELKTTISQKVN